MNICPVHKVDRLSQTTIPRQLELVDLQYQDKYKFKVLRFKIQGANNRQGKRENRQ